MKIFISYAKSTAPGRSAGRGAARGQSRTLVRLSPPIRQPWQEQLLAAITAADAFLYALTPESIASKWCQWEFAEAVHWASRSSR
jgi:hypothetical protein